jgi:hypothetical protein
MTQTEKQARALPAAKSFHRKTGLEEDNSQWTGMNKLISTEAIIRLDDLDGSENDTTDWIDNSRTLRPHLQRMTIESQ